MGLQGRTSTRLSSLLEIVQAKSRFYLSARQRQGPTHLLFDNAEAVGDCVSVDAEQGGRRGDVAVGGEESIQRRPQSRPAIALGRKGRQITLLKRADQQIVLKHGREERGIAIAEGATSGTQGHRQDRLALAMGQGPA